MKWLRDRRLLRQIGRHRRDPAPVYYAVPRVELVDQGVNGSGHKVADIRVDGVEVGYLVVYDPGQYLRLWELLAVRGGPQAEPAEEIIEYRLVRPTDGRLLWTAMAPAGVGPPAPPVSPPGVRGDWVDPPWRYESRGPGGDWELVADSEQYRLPP